MFKVRDFVKLFKFRQVGAPFAGCSARESSCRDMWQNFYPRFSTQQQHVRHSKRFLCAKYNIEIINFAWT